VLLRTEEDALAPLPSLLPLLNYVPAATAQLRPCCHCSTTSLLPLLNYVPAATAQL
jgi:hypothetical protein